MHFDNFKILGFVFSNLRHVKYCIFFIYVILYMLSPLQQKGGEVSCAK